LSEVAYIVSLVTLCNSWRWADTLVCDIVRLYMLLFLVCLSIILFANQNFLDDFLGCVFLVIILFNVFTTKHIVESQNWDSMSEKSVVKLVNSESTSYLKQLSAISAWDLTESCMLIAAGIFWVRVQTVEITGCIVFRLSLNRA